jgi:hypothetical protein
MAADGGHLSPTVTNPGDTTRAKTGDLEHAPRAGGSRRSICQIAPRVAAAVRVMRMGSDLTLTAGSAPTWNMPSLLILESLTQRLQPVTRGVLGFFVPRSVDIAAMRTQIALSPGAGTDLGRGP